MKVYFHLKGKPLFMLLCTVIPRVGEFIRDERDDAERQTYVVKGVYYTVTKFGKQDHDNEISDYTVDIEPLEIG